MSGKPDPMEAPSPIPPSQGNVPYDLRLMRADDAADVRRLFEQVFGKPMSQSLWDWKYAHQAGHAMLVYQGDDLVAHYGGIGRDALWAGERLETVQICDVMVSPAVRNAVRGNSPLRLAVEGFVEHLVGYGKRYLVGFGFPSDRHMKLAEILGLYAPVGGITETTWPLDDKGKKGTERFFPVPFLPLTHANYQRHAPVLDRLWQRLARDLDQRLVGIRDAAYLRRRYLEHPEHDYELCLLRHRLTRRPLGVVVLRHDDGQSLLMDVVGALDDLPRLLNHAGELSRKAGSREMKAWCATAFADVVHTPGATQQRLPITVPTNISAPGPDPAALRDQWWLTAGDTDFQ